MTDVVSGTSHLANVNEITIKPICKFYQIIYKRMRCWFGYTYPYWLSDMDEGLILKCVLQMNISTRMYAIFLNVAIKIRKNNNRSTAVLEEYKRNNPDYSKIQKRQIYYADNIDKIREYNKQYNKMKAQLRASRINIFRKNP